MLTPILKGTLLTTLILLGGLILSLFIGDLTFHLIPGSSVENVKIGHAAVAAVPALIGFFISGAVWGIKISQLAGATDKRRMAKAGLFGFGPITIVLAVGLGVFEPAILAAFNGRFPIHRVFTFLFVPSAFLIAGLSSYAIGRGLHNKPLARTLFWQVGLTAGLTFLTTNLIMESFGWIVGGPRAAESLTMITVLAISNLTAAITAGGRLGHLLHKHTIQQPNHRKISMNYDV